MPGPPPYPPGYVPNAPPPGGVPVFGADQIDTNTMVSMPVAGGYHGTGAVDNDRMDTAAANYNPYWSEYARNQQQYYQRPDISADGSNQDTARQYQQRLIQGLHTLAAGDSNSAAQQSLRQGYDSARGQASSLATTRRNVGAGSAMRGAQRQRENLTAQQSGNSAALMLQQQRAAEQALSQLYAQQRAQDLAQAQQQSQNILANQAANQQGQQSAAALGMGYDLGALNQGGQLASSQLGFNLNQQDINQQYMNALAGAGAAGVATAGQVLGSYAQQGRNGLNAYGGPSGVQSYGYQPQGGNGYAGNNPNAPWPMPGPGGG